MKWSYNLICYIYLPVTFHPVVLLRDVAGLWISFSLDHPQNSVQFCLKEFIVFLKSYKHMQEKHSLTSLQINPQNSYVFVMLFFSKLWIWYQYKNMFAFNYHALYLWHKCRSIEDGTENLVIIKIMQKCILQELRVFLIIFDEGVVSFAINYQPNVMLMRL